MKLTPIAVGREKSEMKLTPLSAFVCYQSAKRMEIVSEREQ